MFTIDQQYTQIFNLINLNKAISIIYIT